MLTLTTVSCDGACPDDVLGVEDVFTSDLCEVDRSFSEYVELDQWDGELLVEFGWLSAVDVGELWGGLSESGHFEVGGAHEDDLITTIRATGTIDTDGTIAGEARSLQVGIFAGEDTDCLSVFSLEGHRFE